MILFIGLILSLLVMSLVWCLYLKTENPGIVDVFWSINIATIGSFYLWQGHGQRLSVMAFILLLIWCLRLALYLYLTRIKQGEKDKRYETLSKEWRQKTIGFLYNYLLQGFLGWLIALPFYFIAYKRSYLIEMLLLALLVVIGVIGETIADLQLLRHRRKKTGKICQIGLWGYSRHPNYFFECLVWLGFSLMGVSDIISMISLLSCVMLFCIMWFITIPLTEAQSLKRRGDAFVAYQSCVSIFIPWFKKDK